jgi:HK97 family phage portal protein
MHQDIEILDRATEADDPGRTPGLGARDYYVMDLLGLQRQKPWVDENTALCYLPFLACVRVISQAVASLGWHVYERGDDGRSKLPVEDDTAWLLNMQASDELNAFEWRQALTKDALTCGNGFAEIERRPNGSPLNLHRISPDRVTLLRDDLGRLLYRIDNGRGADADFFGPRDIFHLRYLSPDGLVGYSPVSLARAAIRVGMSIQSYKDNFFSRGPMPGGALKIPQKLSDKALEETRESFRQVYGGSDNAGKVVVLWGSMEFSPLQLPNDAAQLIESGYFSAEEMCRLFDVPPHKIGDLRRSTFSNIEHQEIAFAQGCLLPWCRRLECEANVKLFGRTNRGRRFTTLNLATLLRGDSTTQMDVVTRGISAGVYTVNEGREYLGLNPIDGGDTPLIQGAMVRLDAVLNPPEPQPSPVPTPTPDPDDPETTDVQNSVYGYCPRCGAPGVTRERRPDGNDRCSNGHTYPSRQRLNSPKPVDLSPFRALLVRAFARQLHVEADKAQRQADRVARARRPGGSAEGLTALNDHIAAFYGSICIENVVDALYPILSATCMFLALPDETAKAVALKAATLHDADSRATLAEHGVGALDQWADRPERQAAAALNLLTQGDKQ